MPYEEIEYVERRLRDLKTRQKQLPGLFEKTKREVDLAIDKVLEKAGVLVEVKVLEKRREDSRRAIQAESDRIAGALSELELVLARLRSVADDIEAEDPSTPDVLHGIDLTKLDETTRLMVVSGNPATIEALGGTLDEPMPSSSSSSRDDDPGASSQRSEPPSQVKRQEEPAALLEGEAQEGSG
jgi:hypothetical protein